MRIPSHVPVRSHDVSPTIQPAATTLHTLRLGGGGGFEPAPAPLVIERSDPAGNPVSRGALLLDAIPDKVFGSFDDAVSAARHLVEADFRTTVERLRTQSLGSRRINGFFRPQPPVNSVAVLDRGSGAAGQDAGFQLVGVNAGIDAFKQREFVFGGNWTKLQRWSPADRVIADATSEVRALVGREVWADLRVEPQNGTVAAHPQKFG